MDTTDGITLLNHVNNGKGIIDVTGLGLNMVNLVFDHQLVDIPTSIIKHNTYAF